MKDAVILAVLCGLAREVSATCGRELPNLPQPGENFRTSIMVDDPNYGQVDTFWEIIIDTFLKIYRANIGLICIGHP